MERQREVKVLLTFFLWVPERSKNPYNDRNMRQIALFLLLLCSCKSTPPLLIKPPRVVSEECLPFIDFIQSNWRLLDSNVFTIQSDTAIGSATRIYFNKMSNTCLKGLSRKEIHQLFGQPSREYNSSSDQGRIDYYLKEVCNHPKSGCIQLKIRINPRKDSVIKVLPMIVESVYY